MHPTLRYNIKHKKKSPVTGPYLIRIRALIRLKQIPSLCPTLFLETSIQARSQDNRHILEIIALGML